MKADQEVMPFHKYSLIIFSLKIYEPQGGSRVVSFKKYFTNFFVIFYSIFILASMIVSLTKNLFITFARFQPATQRNKNILH